MHVGSVGSLHKIVNEKLKDIAGDTYSAATFALYQDPQEGTGYLRAISIGVLVESCAELFAANETSLLHGNPVEPLVKLCQHSDSLGALSVLAKTNCYQNPSVLEREAAGYSALTGLLQCFIPALLTTDRPSGSFESRMLEFLNRRSLVNRAEVTNGYDRILRVLDYISGMTDSYAIESFRRLSGVTT